MTESRGDLQRPLDEGRPPDATTAPETELGPAPETELGPAPETEAGPAPETEAGPAPETGADPAPETELDPVPLRPAAPLVASAPVVSNADADPDAGATPPEPTATAEPAAPTGTATPAAGPPLVLVARQRLGQALRRTGTAWRAGTGATLAWAGRPSGRFLLPGLLVALLVTGAVSTGAVVIPTTWQAAPSESPVPPAPTGAATPTTAPELVPPVVNPVTVAPGRRNNPAGPLAGWAEEMATRTGVPEVALRAYGYAEVVAAETAPGCNLRWTTLAGIGRVESGHGSAGGATLLADGRALPPIVGDPLDGQGDRLLIPDSDGGELDGDRSFDRAVGPMQFIPSTWRSESIDATGDGIADINNIFDAALAAANYLCRQDRDLTVAADWWDAVLSYNNVASYANAVHAAANEYGARSHND